MTTAVIVEGTLLPDGTLELDDKPQMAPGRVRVTVQSLATSGQHGLVQVMDEIREGQRARGYSGRTLEEMQAEEEARRGEDEDYERRMEKLWFPTSTTPAREDP
jgi:hypothetical protein